MKRFSIASGFAAAVILAGVCSAPPAIAQAAAQPAPGWIADPHTGCKIWNPSPQPDESITWSGGCKNGLAEGDGTLQWFEHGKPDVRYEGQYQDGKRNGYGVIINPDGTRVGGVYRDDQPVAMHGNEIDFRIIR